jgi:hypothetical protein
MNQNLSLGIATNMCGPMSSGNIKEEKHVLLEIKRLRKIE